MTSEFTGVPGSFNTEAIGTIRADMSPDRQKPIFPWACYELACSNQSPGPPALSSSFIRS